MMLDRSYESLDTRLAISVSSSRGSRTAQIYPDSSYESKLFKKKKRKFPFPKYTVYLSKI